MALYSANRWVSGALLALLVGGCAAPPFSVVVPHTSEEEPVFESTEPSGTPEQASIITADSLAITPPQSETSEESEAPVVQDSFPTDPLKPGSKGEAVAQLQELLLLAGFYREKIDGVYGKQTQAAVTAAQKAMDLPIEKQWREDYWRTLQAYRGPTLPERPAQPDRVEIDLEKQVLYLIKADQVLAIMPISSGNGETYEDRWGHKVQADTPVGSYTLYRRLNGWRESYLGRLYRPWYFFEGYAIHGSSSVPPKPASHGCVRVPMWDADFLAEELELGMPLYVWGAPTTETSAGSIDNDIQSQQLVDPTAEALNMPVDDDAES